MTERKPSAASEPRNIEPWKRVSLASRIGLGLEAALLAGLLLLVNFFPQRVGVWIDVGGDTLEWRFLPILAPGYTAYLPWLNLWWSAALLLDLALIGRGRWSLALRWLDLAVRVLGVTVLYRLLSGPPIVGLNREWTATHARLRDFWPRLETLEEPLALAIRILLLVFLAILALAALKRLALLLARELEMGPLADEGVSPRRRPEVLDIFHRDARRAYAVLDRDGRFREEPEGVVGKLLHRIRVVFAGVAGQLTPGRRWLFILCLVAAGVDPTPWSLIACAGLFFLLLMELVERVALRDELEIARDLQRDLLPAEPPTIEGYRVATSWRTANEVGGDYHDFLPASEGRTAIVVGDASGHGMAAGLLMAIASATLKAAVDSDPEPQQVAEQLNRALHRAGGRRAFMAIFYGLLDPGSGRLDFICAGQPFPLLLRAAGGVEELGEGALPLGIHERARPSAGSNILEQGDRLILFTDGLAEAVAGPDEEAFGFDRIRQLATAGGSAVEIHDRILAAFERHIADQPLADDITLVVISRGG